MSARLTREVIQIVAFSRPALDRELSNRKRQERPDRNGGNFSRVNFFFLFR